MAGGDLSAVSGKSEVGIGAEVGGDLFRFEFVNVQATGHQGCVVKLEAVFDRIPSPDLRRRGRRRLGCGLGAETCRTERKSQRRTEWPR